MTTLPPSSPVSVLDSLKEKQNQRSDRFYHPMSSSPIKSDRSSPSKPRTLQQKTEQMRQNRKLQRAENKRGGLLSMEKFINEQEYKDYIEQMLQSAPDDIEEEFEEHEQDPLQAELEEMLRLEQEELEAMMESLEL